MDDASCPRCDAGTPFCRGYCRPCYDRMRRTGELVTLHPKKATTFLDEWVASMRDVEGCWVWPKTLDHAGYGRLLVTGRFGPVHRLVYEMLVGPVPDGLVLDHVKDRGCTSRACANPAHLEPVTQRENIMRGDSPSSQHAKMQECVKGHPLSGSNLYLNPKSGERRCRICLRAATRRRQGVVNQVDDAVLDERRRQRAQRR